MKIAFLLTQLEVGGAQVRVFQAAAALRELGHQVDVMLLYRKRDAFGDQPKFILSNSNSAGPISIIKAIKNLYVRLKHQKYELLITNTAPANIIGNTVASFCGPKVRIATQTQPPEKVSFAYRMLDTFVGSIGIYKINAMNSRWTKACFDGYPIPYLKHVKLLYNGITPRVSGLTKSEARAKLGLQGSDFIVANVGRLSIQKDQQTLIKAVANIPCKLLIAGDGELKADLQSLADSYDARDKVQFLGEVSGDQISLLFRAADIFVFTSRWETFGLAPVEAAAAGLPIIASNLPVLQEVLSDEGGNSAAMMIAPGDSAAFSEAIQLLMNDPAEREKLSIKSLLVAERFTLSRHVNALLEAAEFQRYPHARRGAI